MSKFDLRNKFIKIDYYTIIYGTSPYGGQFKYTFKSFVADTDDKKIIEMVAKQNNEVDKCISKLIGKLDKLGWIYKCNTIAYKEGEENEI